MITYPDRKNPPVIALPEQIEVPLARQSISASGVKIYDLSLPQYEVVRVSFVFGAGTSWQHKPFTASVALNTLSEGSQRLSAMEIAERLDYYGSYFDAAIDRDYAVITFCCLKKFFEQTLDVFREILLRPAFLESEVRTWCDKAKQRLVLNRRKVDFVAREAFGQALFGHGHPYAASYSETLYDDVHQADLLEIYRRLYRASNCFVVMSGAVSEEHIAQVAQTADALPGGDVGERAPFPNATSERRLFVPFPDAVQSSVRVGRLLFPRSHPDFIGMQVVANVLGGYFGSRLMQNLRAERGYTYGVYSAMVNFDHAGYMAVAADVGSDVVDDATRQIFNEIERLRSEPVPASELQQVKNIMAGEVMRILDGPFGIADVTIENVQNGVDNTYVSRLLDQVKTITPERVMELSVKYLREEDFTTVVAGPQK